MGVVVLWIVVVCCEEMCGVVGAGACVGRRVEEGRIMMMVRVMVVLVLVEEVMGTAGMVVMNERVWMVVVVVL